MSMKLRDLLAIGAIFATIGLAIYLYQDLPDRMPIRWSPITGDVTGYLPKRFGIWLLASLPVIPFVLLKVSSLSFPPAFPTAAFRRVTDILTTTLTLCLAVAAIAALLAASGQAVPMSFTIRFVAGSALLVFGNYLGKVRKNLILGIRTPWTLANEEIWARTQRLAGWMMVTFGFVLVFTASRDVRPPIGLVIAVALTASFVPLLYSFVLHRRLNELRDE